MIYTGTIQEKVEIVEVVVKNNIKHVKFRILDGGKLPGIKGNVYTKEAKNFYETFKTENSYQVEKTKLNI